ncbi:MULTISPECIES: NAD(P)-dependent oxidoreductase [Rhodococcus]|uniref:NAD-dependent epimerase/dehydratase family protein n=1 Tax=Rhodococcus TaxID=1827 RepID=UPI00193C1D3E|nr:MULTISPECIES: NAD(P)-dependent oxidoreductase [Rhodococcus]QRI77648.1 NAD(P)-dependent oxidoreductase [Rhodococcus aetherivorans]QSE61065.1 NAD(P)-dependent oxidoreductase [Rhodococcus sp. PSBB066]QSE67628.1 NAD(P)-dependent oxidoreductase [Rhodococcus sp. PSBB049]
MDRRRDEGSSQPLRIALIGATGFVGGAVLAALTASGVPCTAVARRPDELPPAATRTAAADLTEPSSLDAVVAAADVIVHAASYTGSDPQTCDAVNRAGTGNLLAAAVRQHRPHVIYVSTIGVYGPGPHRGVDEDAVVPNPVSVLSESRLAAELAVRDYGGTVVRAAFVYGPGDRWFVPGIAQILTRLGAWVEDGRPLLSVISVGDLGRLIAALAVRGTRPGSGGEVLHAAHPDPVSVRALASAFARGAGFDLPRTSLGYDEAVAVAPERGLTERHIDLAGHDHYYDATRIWRETGLRVPPSAFGP